jgi:2-hydroxymuconate-semialdehyde hydrolase
MDLIGYGRSGRKKREPYFDLDLWVRQGRFVIDHLAPQGPVGVIGHSLGGGIALRTALKDKRIAKLMLQGSLGVKIKLNTPIRVSWTPPKSLAAFRKFYKSVIKVRGEISDDFLRERLAVMQKNAYSDYFATMFKGNKQRYIDMTSLSASQLKKLKCEVVMIHGADDTCVPFEEGAVPLADMLPQADLVRLADCGHPCSFDKPEKFMQVAHDFFG